MQHEKEVVVELEDDAFADATDGADETAVYRRNWRIDGPEYERAEKVNPLQRLSDNARRQRLDVDNDVRQLRQSIFPEPLHDLLAGPLMVVVEMQNDRVEWQALVAADRTAPPDVLETIEQSIQPRPDRLHVARQRVRTFVSGAERAGPASLRKIFAERLSWPTPRAGGDCFGELQLIFARHLVHDAPPHADSTLHARGSRLLNVCCAKRRARH